MDNLSMYIALRDKVTFNEVSFGITDFYLFEKEKLLDEQIGYQGDGSWKEEWLVIGYEGALGDPFFIDLGNEKLPVYTAMHGNGEWEEEIVSVSFEAFVKSLELVRELSVNRENPVDLEKNPLDESKRNETLSKIQSLNPGIDIYFWENWISND